MLRPSITFLSSVFSGLFLWGGGAVAYGSTPSTAPYTELSNSRSEFRNFNIETVRGMCFTPDLMLWTVNTHGSTVVRCNITTNPATTTSWPTIQNPVSIAAWSDKVLVVGGSTWAMVEHDRTTGRITRMIDLPAEPADIVVDSLNQWAYVSCQGANVVVRINLNTFLEDQRYAINSQRPRYLYMEPQTDDATSPPRVYVAPFLSGNNSIPLETTNSFTATNAQALQGILDLDTVAGDDLPDEDLYVINPLLPAVSAVSVALRGSGTLMTAHGRNPLTGKYWMLSVESLNKDPLMTSEPALKGKFAEARLAVAASTTGQRLPKTDPNQWKNLDTQSPTGESMSFPYALEFHPNGGAVIASSTSDRLRICDAFGSRLADVIPPPVAGRRLIPRDLLFDPSAALLCVYCWGTNEILVYDFANITAPTGLLRRFSIGLDPTPKVVREGRDIWYDASRSLNGRTTCNTCHPGGKFDGLAWPISDSPRDYKHIMVTQSLLSIEETFPYHWRGERTLDDFNGAFMGLLGANANLSTTRTPPQPPGALPGPSELDKFKAFIFSLQAPVNPKQSIQRVVDNSIAATNGGTATSGQTTFNTKPVLGGLTCQQCHTSTTGSNGSPVLDAAGVIPSITHLDVAHLRELTHKNQPQITLNVTMPNGNTVAFDRARNGYGILHDGVPANLFEFIDKPPFEIDPVQRQDITAFVEQFDGGLAPAAQRAWKLDSSSNGSGATTVGSFVQNTLIPQANSRWIDLVAIGRDTVLGVVRDHRWYYDPTTALFRTHDMTYSSMTIAGLRNLVSSSSAVFIFMGVPPGSGVRVALDRDNDGLTDDLEAFWATQPMNPDTDNDTYPDGYEVSVLSSPVTANTPTDNVQPNLTSWTVGSIQASTIQYFARFTEPSVWMLEILDARAGAGNSVVSKTYGFAPARESTLIAQSLYPSTQLGNANDVVRTYSARLTLMDLRNNTRVINLTPANGYPLNQTKTQVFLQSIPFSITISEKFQETLAQNANTVMLKEQFRIRYKGEQSYALPLGVLRPAAGKILLAQVLVEQPNGDWIVSKNTTTQTVLQSPRLLTSFSVRDGSSNIVPYNALAGDFVYSTPSLSDGWATFEFTRSGLTSQQKVRLNIIGIVDPLSPGVFDGTTFLQWEMPTTPPALREHTVSSL